MAPKIKVKLPTTTAAEANEVQNKYRKLDHRDHVLARPGMYIGSIEEDAYSTWVFDDQKKSVEKREIRIIPGLYKIFDEILVNAIDHTVRMKAALATGGTDIQPVKNIRISIDKASGAISVTNDGNGIEVEKHPEHGIYVPELIFGHMLTSTNYDDSEEKIIGGQNGIGAKACNIFSKSFKLETVDHVRKKLYTQEWTDNMTIRTEPVIKACAKKPYTTITFIPDYARFKMAGGMSNDMYSLIMRRCYDVCALTDNDVNVWLNGTKLEFKNFERYVDLYLGARGEKFRVYEKINDRWEVAATYTEVPGFDQVSFVNGIATIHGGKHVDHISSQICSKMVEMIHKRKKDADVKPQHVKNYLMLFVRSTISNPTFSSQSKEQLTTPASKFGGTTKAEISDKFIEKLYKSEFTDKVLNLCDAAASKNLKKTDGKKTSRILVHQLDDANLAGTKDSADCTLILTEGLSARTMAISGLSVVGRDKYGVFPLRGKILNVKDAPAKKIQENEEITNLKKILGLEHGKEYKDVSDLRYGKIMIMTDQDTDGFHIKGLLFNVFQSLWPSLYKQPFLTCMLTPIIKVTHARTGEVHQFYSELDYERWQANNPGNGWKVKYFKGLGTSTEDEAKKYFNEMKKVTYTYNDAADEALDLAFNKKRADDRKEWLMQYNRERGLDYNNPVVPFDDFVHKELIHFSNRDLERSINHLCDGLKESTRKILFACFKRGLFKDEMKVAQLAAYVASVSEYKHGEVSLQEAIVGMAQVFVGANNINLLLPNGQFGTRIQGGSDHASCRYIFTLLSNLARKIFKEEDNGVLKYIEDEGVMVEPEYYIPIIPMILVNGGIGIGTGFSTNIPCHNPEDIINRCVKIADMLAEKIGAIEDASGVAHAKALINEIELDALTPWYLGFTGSILPHKNGSFLSKGSYKWIDDMTVEITELPIGTWTDDYKEMLTEMVTKGNQYLKDFDSHYTAKSVKFMLKMHPDARRNLGDKFETEFNMSSTKNLSLNNIHLHGDHGAIKRFKDTLDVLKSWAPVRIAKYLERKQYQLAELERAYNMLMNKVRFIRDIIDGKIVVINKELEEVEAQLSAAGYSAKSDGDEGGYGYLTRMPIHQLTRTKMVLLEAEAARMEAEINNLKNKSIQAIWKEELEELRSAWQEHRTAIEAEYTADRENKPVAQKKRAVVRRAKA